MVVPFEVYLPFTPVSATLTQLQGHRSINYLKLKLVFCVVFILKELTAVLFFPFSQAIGNRRCGQSLCGSRHAGNNYKY